MAQQRVEPVFSAAALTSANDGDGGVVDLSSLKGPWLAEIVAERTAGASTLDAKIQDAMNAEGPWYDWITFTQLNGDGNEFKAATREPMPFRKVVTTVGAATTYAVDVRVAGFYA